MSPDTTENLIAEFRQRMDELESGLMALRGEIAAQGAADDIALMFERVPPRRFPWHLLSFGYKKVGAAFTVNAGAVYQEGKTRLAFSETTLTLTGSTEYVYAQCTRSLASALITHASTLPATTDTNYQFPLYKLTSADGGANYALEAIYNMGDIHLDTPMV